MSIGRPAASVALISAGRVVLLIERARAPYAGFWTLPGGSCQDGEAPADCARRELDEELRLRAGLLVPVARHRSASFHLHVFAAEDPGDEPTPNSEIAAWRRVDIASLETLRTTPGLGAVLDAAIMRLAIAKDRAEG